MDEEESVGPRSPTPSSGGPWRICDGERSGRSGRGLLRRARREWRASPSAFSRPAPPSPSEPSGRGRLLLPPLVWRGGKCPTLRGGLEGLAEWGAVTTSQLIQTNA